MKKVVILLICAVYAGCNTSPDKSISDNHAGMTAEIYADSVYKIWEESISDLNDIIGNTPPLNEKLEQQVNELKEKTIEKLLPYGSERAKQPDQIQKVWSTKLIMNTENLLKNRDWDNTMNKCYKHYFIQDYKFASLIASFNTITQYADFGLLKKQSPAEAQRLNIH
jgi:hypothetical protein